MSNLYKEFFESVGKEWLLELNNYNDVPFKRKTAKVKWSIAEIYSHLGMLTLNHIDKIQECFSGAQQGSRAWIGSLVFFKGSIGNKKLLNYDAQNFNPISSLDLKEAKDLMYKTLKLMEEWGARISKETPKGKVEHPVLGFLSAEEWYKLIVMHFNYHKKNKQKIHQLLMY